MEKLGISREDLLKELKDEYGKTREALASQSKIASEGSASLSATTQKLAAIRTKIDELESQLSAEGQDA